MHLEVTVGLLVLYYFSSTFIHRIFLLCFQLIIQAGGTDKVGLGVLSAEKLKCWNTGYFKITWCSKLVIVPRNNKMF